MATTALTERSEATIQGVEDDLVKVCTVFEREEGWHPLDSVAWCQRSERLGKGSKLVTGLELLRAKNNLPHSAWYPYLWLIPMSQPTAWRRMKLAKDFIEWANVKGKLLGEQAFKAIALIETKSFTLSDFFAYLDAKEFRAEDFLPDESSDTPSPWGKNIFGVSFRRPMAKIHRTIEECFKGWSSPERQEAIDTLDLLENWLHQEKEGLSALMRLEVVDDKC